MEGNFFNGRKFFAFFLPLVVKAIIIISVRELTLDGSRDSFVELLI